MGETVSILGVLEQAIQQQIQVAVGKEVEKRIEEIVDRKMEIMRKEIRKALETAKSGLETQLTQFRDATNTMGRDKKDERVTKLNEKVASIDTQLKTISAVQRKIEGFLDKLGGGIASLKNVCQYERNNYPLEGKT